jgi:hypothetical protein
VGDSRAFATVYAAMCRSAGLECMTVTGTRAGEPWTWNIILDNGGYYHVDLQRSNLSGQFRELTDSLFMVQHADGSFEDMKDKAYTVVTRMYTVERYAEQIEKYYETVR